MPKKSKLTPEQKKENRKKLDLNLIKLYDNKIGFDKICQFASQKDSSGKLLYKSRNACLLGLIKSHPDFLKMFPKKEVIKLTATQLIAHID